MRKVIVATLWMCLAVGCSRGGKGHDGGTGLGDGGDGGSAKGDGGVGNGDGGIGNGDGGVGMCNAGSPQMECQSAADCDDGNPSTVDSCNVTSGGEFSAGTCLHAGCDGGISCANQAIDTTCGTDAGQVYPPFVPLVAPDVPSDCKNGFQLTDATPTLVYNLQSKTLAGSRALMLDLDIATYTAADGVQITGVDGNCKKYTLFDTCHLKTADKSEMNYGDGMMRPDDITIRQYHLDLRPGTTQLSVDFGRVVSPMYIQVLGLCDFDLPTPAVGSVKWFAPVP